MSRTRRLQALGCALSAALLVASPTAKAETVLRAREAVELALARNPNLAAALATRQSATWAVVGEDAAFSPTLHLNAAVDHTETPAVTPTGTTRAELDTLRLGSALVKRLRLGTDLALRVEHNRRWEDDHRDNVSLLAVGPVYDTSVRLELTQPLWRGSGRAVVEGALLVARGQETEAESAAERTASQLVRDVLIAWWELWYADEALRIEEQALSLAEQQRDEAMRRVELGSEAPVSILTFETRVAERLEGVATASRQREERAVALAALLGESGMKVRTGERDVGPVVAPDAEVAKSLAMERSPEVREAEAALRLAGVRADITSDPSRPRLDVQGYGEAGGLSEAFVGFGGGDHLAWAAGVNLIFELPLSGRVRQAALEQARFSVYAADRRLAQARLTATSAVEAELARIESASTRLALASRTARVAEEQLQAERRRYEIGTSTPIEVLQAEEAVRTALIREARAEVDLRSAEAAMEHLIGALVTKWIP